ncbi:hypothetical protein O181_024520 [Austropuccinia psidii MF-1]|uniref:Uncharacterized protein n=1 Tax=Austropuccinia psidii MF-1 TaxID=1389203 RepID=A0A9Q3CKQ3_9BASI|nr:hypothetical protein [Austropuccinia psidii MF-1]
MINGASLIKKEIGFSCTSERGFADRGTRHKLPSDFDPLKVSSDLNNGSPFPRPAQDERVINISREIYRDIVSGIYFKSTATIVSGLERRRWTFWGPPERALKKELAEK